MSRGILLLNCDMGENEKDLSLDKSLMPHIDMANISCGYHGGNETSICHALRTAKQEGKRIGAHPSYPDRVHFGRKSMPLDTKQIKELIVSQCRYLSMLCAKEGVTLAYIKPHGALYHDMMQDKAIFEAIVEGVSELEGTLKLMVPAALLETYHIKTAHAFGVGLLKEIFADRAYESSGVLVARAKVGAVIDDEVKVAERIKLFCQEGYIQSREGKRLYLDADTVCLHSDTPNAPALAKAIRRCLREDALCSP